MNIGASRVILWRIANKQKKEKWQSLKLKQWKLRDFLPQ
jgi:hypothetical protein